MHAVVVRVSINDYEGGRALLEERVVPQASSAPGFVSGHWTTSEQRDNGLSMIVFESEEAARAMADQIEQPPTDAVTLENVEVREVAAHA